MFLADIRYTCVTMDMIGPRAQVTMCKPILTPSVACIYWSIVATSAAVKPTLCVQRVGLEFVFRGYKVCVDTQIGSVHALFY